MTMEVTVSLPDQVYRRALHLAHLSQRPVSEVLTETIALALPTLPDDGADSTPLAALDNAALLALTTQELPPADDAHLSALLEQQQAGTLTEEQRSQLAGLMQVYQLGLLRKAQALEEAVRRGLRAPLAP